jgi:hypothetical protein
MSLLLALTGAGGGNSQALAITLDGVTVAVSQTAEHSQALAITLDDVTALINQSVAGASNSQALAITLDDVSVEIQQAGPVNNQVWGGHWQPYWLDKREWEKKIPQKAVQAIERIAQSEKRGEAAEQALRAEISDFQTRYSDMLRGMQAMQVNTLQALRLMQMREIARIEQEIEDENTEFLLLM